MECILLRESLLLSELHSSDAVLIYEGTKKKRGDEALVKDGSNMRSKESGGMETA